MAKQNGTRSSSRSAIDDTRFRKQRLFHPGYIREGLRVDQPELAVRIQKSGIRHTFNLNTANRDKAARKAAEIYAHLVAAGWSDTLRRYAPKTDTERLVRRVDELARRARQSTDPKNFSHLKKVPAKN